jgi:uncharacterized protein (DUF2236 family)
LIDVQRSLGLLLRAKVAGADAAEQAERIWGKAGPRWFAAGDPIWRVHRDASMFVGGITALLLQSLHPLAMAGVAGHSGYKSDPWGRLQRTSHYLAVTTYGTVPDAEEAIARVRSVHRRVRGQDQLGRPYRASDPHLLKWVHLAEADSFLRSHQAFGAAPLTPAEADTYVAQAAVPARLLGVVDPPETVAGLAAQLANFRPELEATAAASEAARFLLFDPPLPLLARPGYGTLAAGAVSLLPAWARSALQLPVPDGLADIVGRPLGRFSVGVVRWALAAVPDGR